MAQISTPKQVRGWITPTLFALVSSLSCIGRCIIPSAELKGDPTPAQALERSEARAKFVDTFVAACMVLGFASLLAESFVSNQWVKGLIVVFPVWRLVDVLAADIRMCIFDPFDDAAVNSVPEKRYVSSTASRVIVLGICNYLELFVCFAAIYAHSASLIAETTTAVHWSNGGLGNLERALHLSVASQLTIGFGDLTPDGWLRPVVWLQGAAGLAILALFITRYMSLLPQRTPPTEKS